MTVEDFLATSCLKKSLNPVEHFVRVKKRRDMASPKYFVPHRADLIETYVSRTTTFMHDPKVADLLLLSSFSSSDNEYAKYARLRRLRYRASDARFSVAQKVKENGEDDGCLCVGGRHRERGGGGGEEGRQLLFVPR
jgi:hypothetical protein